MEGQAIRGTAIEVPIITEDQFCAVYEQLDYGTPREAQVRIANFLCSLELGCEYTVKQHVYVAGGVGRTLLGRHLKVRHATYGEGGMDGADIELAFLMADLDEVVE